MRPFRSACDDGTNPSVRLLNDLVSPKQQRLRDGEAKRPRRLHVDHEIELGRLFDGNVRGLRAPKDPIDEGCATSYARTDTRAVRHESASLDVLPEPVH